MEQKIFITGITGFAGSYLAKYLRDLNLKIFGTYLNSPHSSDLQGVELIQLDLIDKTQVKNVMEELNPDYIFHLAALTSNKQSFEDPARVLTNNITAELNILEVLKDLNSKARILITSSAEVYGKVDKKNLPIDEDTPLNPTTPYAVSKIAQDYLGLQYFSTFGLEIIRARPFNHIGPGQSDIFVTSAFAKKIAEIEKGKTEPVLTVGNLEAKRDFTDVRDMVKAYYLLIQKGVAGEVYNIGSGKDYAISEVLNILLSFSDKEIEVKVDKDLLRPNDTPELVSDNSKIKKATGWKAEIPLEKSLLDILEYWRRIV